MSFAKTSTWFKSISLLETAMLLVLILVSALAMFSTYRHKPDDVIKITARTRDEMQAIYIYLINRQHQLKIPMPATDPGLASLVGATGINGVLTEAPRDPWGRPYQYRNPGKNKIFDLFSLGPDGIESNDDIVFGLR